MILVRTDHPCLRVGRHRGSLQRRGDSEVAKEAVTAGRDSGKSVPLIGSDDNMSLQLQGVEGDEGGRPIDDERLERGRLTGGGDRQWRWLPVRSPRWWIPAAGSSTVNADLRGRWRHGSPRIESHGRGRNGEEHAGYLVEQGGENRGGGRGLAQVQPHDGERTGRGGGPAPAQRGHKGGGGRSGGGRQGRSGTDRWAPATAWGSAGRGCRSLTGGPRPQ
jgi:hypothetical protein